MEEPLLGQASSSTGDHGPDSGSTALVPRSINRIDWEQLWRVLCSGCRASWHSVLGASHALTERAFFLPWDALVELLPMAGAMTCTVCAGCCSHAQQLLRAAAAAGTAPRAPQRDAGLPHLQPCHAPARREAAMLQ